MNPGPTATDPCSRPCGGSKFCIDQLNIDESLLYLPVFASASRTVLVAVGPSYFSRLWCMWEMFVMSHCTDNFHNVVFWPLSGCDTTQVAEFQAKDVGCFKAEDKDKILSTIESLNGGVAQFEQVVRRDVLNALLAASVRFEPDVAVTDGAEVVPAASRSRRLSTSGGEDMRMRLSLMEKASMSSLPLRAGGLEISTHPDDVVAAFNRHDRNGSGALDCGEVLRRLNPRWT